MNKITKKVTEYFKFIQDNLKKNYNGKYKSPVQIKDKEERDNFFAQVRRMWQKRKRKQGMEDLDDIKPLSKELNAKEKEYVAKSLLENLPEALQEPLSCTSWKYDLIKFKIEDEDSGKEYEIDKNKAITGLEKFLEALKKGKYPGLHLNKESGLGGFDAEAIDHYVQYIIFGKAIYG